MTDAAQHERVYNHVGSDWTELRDVAANANLHIVGILPTIVALVNLGVIEEEIPGGRVRRVEGKPLKRRKDAGLAPCGPPDPGWEKRLDVTEDVDFFLQEQYEPVSTLYVAWKVYVPLDQAAETLRRLEERGRAIRLEDDDLWVGA